MEGNKIIIFGDRFSVYDLEWQIASISNSGYDKVILDFKSYNGVIDERIIKRIFQIGNIRGVSIEMVNYN